LSYRRIHEAVLDRLCNIVRITARATL